MKPAPDAKYVQLLNDARADAGWPSLRQISELSGISKTHVAVILNGASRPSYESLRTLVAALVGAEDPAQAAAIFKAYDESTLDAVSRRRGAPPGAPKDAEIIAAAIRDGLESIARAIRESRDG